MVRFVGCVGLAKFLAPGRDTYGSVWSAALKWRQMRAFSNYVSECIGVVRLTTCRAERRRRWRCALLRRLSRLGRARAEPPGRTSLPPRLLTHTASSLHPYPPSRHGPRPRASPPRLHASPRPTLPYPHQAPSATPTTTRPHVSRPRPHSTLAPPPRGESAPRATLSVSRSASRV